MGRGKKREWKKRGGRDKNREEKWDEWQCCLLPPLRVVSYRHKRNVSETSKTSFSLWRWMNAEECDWDSYTTSVMPRPHPVKRKMVWWWTTSFSYCTTDWWKPACVLHVSVSFFVSPKPSTASVSVQRLWWTCVQFVENSAENCTLGGPT